MSKNPFDLNAMANQTKGMKAAQAVGQVALSSAQEIAQLNQRSRTKQSCLCKTLGGVREICAYCVFPISSSCDKAYGSIPSTINQGYWQYQAT
jgi:hypothetical protein